MKEHARTRQVRTVAASEFKAKCLALFEEVGAGGGELAVSKRGKIVACLEGIAPSQTLRRPSLAQYVRFSGDVESPIDGEWKALR